MKKTIIGGLLLIGLFVLMFCQGCAGTIAAWRDPEGFNKIKVAEWTQKGEASKAASKANSQPLATMKATSGEVFTVYNPNKSAPMPVVGEPNAIVQGIKEVVPVLEKSVIGWTIKEVVQGIKSDNYTANNGGTIDVAKNSNNSIDVETNHAEEDSTISDETHTESDYAATDTDNSATATPTIVTQPDPVIVEPAETVVVTQPEPVIVYPTEAVE